MSVLTGILIDTSGSMKQNTKGRLDDGDDVGSWARSIFTTADNLIKHDVSSSNKVFAIGYGADMAIPNFDLLKAIREASALKTEFDHRSKRTILEDILITLKDNGAPRVREWATIDQLDRRVTLEQARIFSAILTQNQEFLEEFVLTCLPFTCRHELSVDNAKWSPFTFLGNAAVTGVLNVNSTFRDRKTDNSIQKAVKNGMELVWKFFCPPINEEAILSVHEASEIIHGCTDGEDLTKERVDKLMKYVEPFIYGLTPMFKALGTAICLLDMGHVDQYKLLFVLSDGIPTDHGSIPDFAGADVHVVSCYITRKPIPDPRRLYSRPCPEWEKGAKFMFSLSSKIPTQLLPRTIFLKRGWKIDIENNETKLFFQVNHPDIIKDVCSLARDVVCCQDALTDILSDVSLDVYINQANEGFGAKEQEGGTCYANATAAVMHLAMKRIVGREDPDYPDGYPDFFDVRQKLITKYGQS